MRRVIRTKELRESDPVQLARDLLGKFLVRRRTLSGAAEARMITEVEAYHGECDLACHARAGRTARTAVLYEDAGVWYVYLCYGIHEMLNLVVGPKDWPAAILIRGVEGIVGPGRVTKQLAIDRKLNGLKAEPANGLWIEDRGVIVPDTAVTATPRIGVDYAGEEWAQKPWRFVITGASKLNDVARSIRATSESKALTLHATQNPKPKTQNRSSSSELPSLR